MYACANSVCMYVCVRDSACYARNANLQYTYIPIMPEYLCAQKTAITDNNFEYAHAYAMYA